MEDLLKIIEEERYRYISHNWGRLDAAIRIEYWDPETREYGNFLDSDRQPMTDPYQLSIRALSKLPVYRKRIEMLNTVTFMGFYMMHSADRERIEFLAKVQEKIEAGVPLTGQEQGELTGGHEAVMERWKEEDKWQYYDDDPMHGLGIG